MIHAMNFLARSAAAVAIVLCLLISTGCGNTDLRPEASGPFSQITVVMDSSQWTGAVGEAARDALAGQIATLPNPEPYFDLHHVDLSTERNYNYIRDQRNVVFIAPLSDSTQEANYLRNLLSEEAQQAIQEGGTAVVPRQDEWRRRQHVVYVVAATADALAATLRESGPRLRDMFNQVTRERAQREMFEHGRQPALEDTLMAHHGFAVNVQHDYLIAVDTTNFVWLRRILSDTWRSLFVYYEENANPADLTPEWVYTTHDSLTRAYLQGTAGGWVTIDYRRPLITEEINFKERYALETRGLWHMVGEMEGEQVQFGGGGPFVTYSFYDQASGRLYMIDGMVFAPNYDKREFLRQMEVIAYTFRTRQDVEQPAEVAASE